MQKTALVCHAAVATTADQQRRSSCGRLSRQLIFEWRRTLATGERLSVSTPFHPAGRFSYSGFGRKQLVPRILAPLRSYRYGSTD